MKIWKFEIDLSRQGNFIAAVLLIHFVFFGYICNVYHVVFEAYSLGEEILFLYQILFYPPTMLSLVILIGIIFIMAVREHFFEYGVRNSIWLIPFIIIMSWFWYWFLNRDYLEMLSRSTFQISGLGFIVFIGTYFIRIETYLTILTLLCINLFTAVAAALTKEKYKKYLEKIKSINNV